MNTGLRKKQEIFLKMVLLVKMANLQKHPFFSKLAIIERCMKDEQEEREEEI